MQPNKRESEKPGEALDDADGFDADADYLANEENDVVGVAFTIGVGVAFDLERSLEAEFVGDLLRFKVLEVLEIGLDDRVTGGQFEHRFSVS
jgi:hypothetical protein